jgi:hypothetical protein
MQAAPSAPALASVPSSSAATAAPWAGPPASGPMEPPPRRRSRLRLIVVVVVVIIIVGIVGILLYESSQTVTVNYIYFQSPDNTCGLGESVSYYGFNASLGETVQLGFAEAGNNTTNGGTGACTIHTATTSTSGFTIASANLPLVIPVNDTSAVLWLNITVPNSSYTGSLTIQVT